MTDGQRSRAATIGLLMAAAAAVAIGLGLRMRPRPERGAAALAASAAATRLAAEELRVVAERGESGAAAPLAVARARDSLPAFAATPAFLALHAAAEESLRDPQGRPWLRGVDTWRWLRRAENLADHGSFGEEERDGRAWDPLVVPDGRPADGNLAALFAGGTAALLRGADAADGADVVTLHAYGPIVSFLLTLGAAGLLAHRLGGAWAAVFAMVAVSLQPLLVVRTSVGVGDTDAWNDAVLLVVAALAVETLLARRRRSGLILATAAGLALGVFAWSWAGWWFALAFLLPAVVLATAFEVALPSRREGVSDRARERGLRVLVLLASCAATTLVLADAQRFALAWWDPLRMLGADPPALPEVGPDAYATVDELRPATAGEVLAWLGGAVPVLLGAVGIAAALRRRSVLPGLALLLWAALGLFAGVQGRRFVLLAGPPLAVGLGLALAGLLAWARRRLPSRPGVAAAAGPLLTGVVFAAFLAGPARHRYAELDRSVPLMNDSFEATFTAIREQTPPDAVVCAWWDYGDLVTARTGRRVVFDAGSQRTGLVHWMARALASDDPGESRAILGLLSRGVVQRHLASLRRAGLDATRATDLLVDAARAPDGARPALLAAAGVDAATAQDVLGALAAEPPPTYLWLTEDLTAKAPAWGMYGRWDFARGRSALEGAAFSGPALCAVARGRILFEDGTALPAPAGGAAETLLETDPPVVIARRAGHLRAYGVPPPLAGSLYVRLMYLEPRGLPGFERVHDAESVVGQRTALFRVAW